LKYDEPEEGEWIFPVMEGYKMSCCDCGLVHRIDFRICEDDPGRIEFRVFRDNRATGQIRRHRDIKVKHTYE
jgi:hypothetical protein